MKKDTSGCDCQYALIAVVAHFGAPTTKKLGLIIRPSVKAIAAQPFPFLQLIRRGTQQKRQENVRGSQSTLHRSKSWSALMGTQSPCRPMLKT